MKNLIIISPHDSIPERPAAAADRSLSALAPGSAVFYINDVDPFPQAGTVSTPFPYGWGGIQKTALTYAVENKFEAVTMIGYDNTTLESDLKTILETTEEDGVCFYTGPSEGLCTQALEKIFGWIAGVPVEGMFSLARTYPVHRLHQTAFHFNAFGPHFDTEMTLQLTSQNVPRKTFPSSLHIPSAKKSPSRLWNDFKTCLKFRLQKYGFLYDRRYHPSSAAQSYEPKFSDLSPHTLVLKDDRMVPPGTRVLDIGCSTGYVCEQLEKKKNCTVLGVDMIPPDKTFSPSFRYFQMDLEKDASRIAQLIEQEKCDVVLMLDVLEHLSNPEFFLLQLFQQNYTKTPKFVFSTGNVAFAAVRLMLMLGFFNYGERGILDVTHKRLFSFRTFKNLMEQTGFYIRRQHFLPLPLTKMGMSTSFLRMLTKLNILLIRIFPSLFAYQILFEAELLSFPSEKK